MTQTTIHLITSIQSNTLLTFYPDAESLSLLAETVTMLGSLPELPTRESFDPLLPEGLEVDPDDEVDLDPAQIKRPFDTRNTAL